MASQALPAAGVADDGIFTEIAELAAQLCGAAHAIITLHQEGAHRPLAACGSVALDVLPRDSRFCCEVLHSGAPLEVSDARFDLRFHDDPLVARVPRIRFYSGVPLQDNAGRVRGTLSVLDERPKTLEDAQRAALWKLADVVMRLLGDIEARREAEASLSWQARHDALTDLANRREFEAIVEAHLARARAGSERHAVLYIDLDQFKVVNDTCGHLAGDALLRELSALLASRMRRGDCLARLGGDEFGVLLPGCDLRQAQQIAGHLLAAIRDLRFAWGGQVFKLGASIGVAGMDASTPSVEAVLAAADTACYMAKDKGRNQVQAHRDDDDEVSSRRGEMGWVSRITRSVEEDRFVLHCQRVVRLGGGDDEYLELLLRMKDEHGRLVPPTAFVPAAERYHLMGRIDRWVVDRVLACLARIGTQGAPLPRFGVNLSGMSLSDVAFVEHVEAAFERHAVPGALVTFEVTETAAISSLAQAARFIERLRQRGCRFALDDFGSGLSSFAYLRSLPVDYLKIDGAFVRGRDGVDAAAMDAIQRLASAVGARTIAESVDGPEVLERVRRLGIDCAQGYFLHRPEPYPVLAARGAEPQEACCAA